MSNQEYHIPVLLNSSVDGLNINPDGTYVDVTFGGGGHSREILSRLSEKGRLFAFDQDEDAQRNIIEDDRFVLIPQNFQFIQNYLALYGVDKVDGVLADLGVSSHQFNVGERGFSTRFDGDLDMRMDQSQELTARQMVNQYEFDKLAGVLRLYGELKNPGRTAQAIIAYRDQKEIETTGELIEAVEGCAGKKRNQYYAQVFQAIRIEVNAELKVLEEFLMSCKDVIKEGGRLSVISYHSLEDRLVKNFVKKGKFEGVIEKDFYGNVLRPFKEVNRKLIVPSEQEIESNSRARSAKLRVAEKI